VPERTVCVDCDTGRKMGCATFCCRLWVRLSEEEAVAFGGDRALPKSEDGLCVHLDRQSHLCSIWEGRPAACRGYDCNHDRFLQVVLKEGFQSLKQVVTSKVLIPLECHVQIPVVSISSESDWLPEST